jgi:glycosyltransferase involved in cell wall biosynthesis
MLLRSLDRAKYQPGVLAFFRTGTAGRLLEVPGVSPRVDLGLGGSPLPDPLVRRSGLPTPTLFTGRYLWRASAVLRRARPDLVYLNNTPYSHLGMILACQLLRVPFVCHLRDTVRLTRSDVWSLTRASRAVVLSEAALDFYALQGVDRTKLRIVYNGIDPEEYARHPAAVVARGRSRSRSVVLTGSLIPRKRQILALQALEVLARDFPDVRLTLVGDGPDRRTLEDWIRRHGLDRSVSITGWTEDVAPHLAEARTGLMVSDREGMPNVVLEYMAASLPVVATDLPGLREMVADGQTGFVVAPGDLDGLVRSLRILLSEEALAREMGERGWAVLDSGRFTVAEEHRRIAGVLDEVGAEHRSARRTELPRTAVSAARVPTAVRHRIALVESGSGLGGTSRCVHDWLACFDAERYDFHVFGRAPVGWYPKIALSGRARSVVFTGVGLPPEAAGRWVTRYEARFRDLARMVPAAWRYFRWFRRLGIDLVHTNNNLFGQLPAIIAARLASVPVICHLHDQLPLTWVERKAVPLADLYLVLNSQARDLYSRWIPRTKLEIVPNGLLLAAPEPGLRSSEREAASAPSVGVVGRLIEWKGQETLVRAFPRVRSRFPAAHLYVIGDDPSGSGDYPARLQGLVAHLGLSDAVTFTGWLDDPAPMLARMDAAVCPSLAPEPFGLVMLEAMALGVPVVASRHGGPVDIIEEGRDGLLFRPGDVEDLAEKIVSLLEDPALSRRLAEAAMTKVRTQYTMEALVSQIQRAYDRLLLGRRPRRPA